MSYTLFFSSFVFSTSVQPGVQLHPANLKALEPFSIGSPHRLFSAHSLHPPPLPSPSADERVEPLTTFSKRGPWHDLKGRGLYLSMGGVLYGIGGTAISMHARVELRCMLVSCTYHTPKVGLSGKKCLPVTDKQ